MHELRDIVKTARTQLIERGEGGYPVVYAVRVEPEWFGEGWERYLIDWNEMGTSGNELKCRGVIVGPERLVARADFPNGTDPHFLPTHITQWDDIEETP